jgi:broad specificity polyphosphatase/5'/3'-nucleotidase SurE/ADP-ribose pyrophosphatase YjhB (NUDIX family)
VVRHGLLRFAPRQPDLLIAGINYGENMGAGTTVSGTVGAAWEGASAGILSIALSLDVDLAHHYQHSEEIDFHAAAHFARVFAEAILRHRLPAGVQLLNINVPADATPHSAWRLTRVSGYAHYHTTIETSESGEKIVKGYHRQIDWAQVEPDTDIYALFKDKVVSVSPLTIDISARTSWRELQKHLPVPAGQLILHHTASFKAENAVPTQTLKPIEPNELRRLSRTHGKPQRMVVSLDDSPLKPFGPFKQTRFASALTEKANRRGEVVMAIRLRDGKLLLHTKDFYPRGVFRLLTGGIHPDESVGDALWREVAEETSLPARLTQFVALIEYEVAGARDPFVSYVFLLDSDERKPTVQDSNERITAFKEVAPQRLRAIAKQLRALKGDWRAWGEFRAAAHEAIANVLEAEERGKSKK